MLITAFLTEEKYHSDFNRSSDAPRENVEAEESVLPETWMTAGGNKILIVL